MARKPSNSQPEPKPLKLLISPAEAEKKIQERIEKGLELKKRPVNSQESLETVKKDFYTWDEYNTEMLKMMFTNQEKAEEYSSFLGGVMYIGHKSIGEEISDLNSDIDSKMRRLESILGRLELIPVDESIGATIVKPSTAPSQEKKYDKVFIVHGHDEAAREMVARFLEKLDIEPIILHEQANEGNTIIEKLEKNSDVGFSVVLLTPDDEGKKKGIEVAPKDRARQNVVLELGFFLGKLGRKNVCALFKGSVEIPSDYLGVVFIQFDEAEGWKFRLAREMKAAGFVIDMNKAV